ncbi:MAG: hypothetical protein HRU72_13085 [Planctomycetia bacterium]|uniref:Uncharacterized protein n=1 Tax=Candidatus Brocadia sapporoensis TaxID=392547 RepID=A0A1V6M1E0_9BACT|nr:hypothetical protein [Candidatus Brocadia sp.]OQD46212.1 hypothetical protein BIY37_04430 [Candidatus Brocadia sapporoensis]QOJ07410.1 MAG: hypothetical protein HRU72_13085 [Planctomycetia bacterium]TVL95538.1 MAG: hypothetical protein CV082_10460 [Candidatus Brocadia sp. BL1]
MANVQGRFSANSRSAYKETLTNTLKSYTKWVFQSACEIIASPDVGNKGAIYIGPWGKMYAITPEEN